MNHRVRRSFLLVLLVISVTLALVVAASAQGPVTKDKPGDKGWSALDKVDRL
jgi:competence protein ComGC